MIDWERRHLLLARRTFLGRTVGGLGSLALASLLEPRLFAGEADGRLKVPHYQGVVHPRHFTPKVKRIIWLYMAGGPSHLETLDHKPKLAAMNGKPMPESITKGQPIAQLQGAKLTCMAPQHPFRKCGQSGQEIATIFPHLSSIADEICIVRSLRTEAINHDPAHTFMNTGTTISGRPSMGSWLWYGLGSECDNLPGFVVLASLGRHGQAQPIATRAMAQRLSAQQLPGRRVPLQGRSGAVRQQPRRRHAIAAARRGGRDAGTQPTLQRHDRRSRGRARASASTKWPSACRRACQD